MDRPHEKVVSCHAPIQGYSAPIQGYSAPNQGYIAPNQGYSAPNQGYIAPTPTPTPTPGYIAPTPTPGYIAPIPVKALSKFVEKPIKCSIGAFYNFFKTNACLLPSVCSAVVHTVQLADGNRSWVNTVGSRKVIEILAAESCIDTAEKFKYEVEALDDHSREIKYKLLEGPLLQLYDSFTVTLQVTTGSTAKWTVEYVKKDPGNKDPDFYLQLFPTINATVERHILSNNH